MIILPAIDLKDGTCVRLFKGDFNTVSKVAEDPIETANSFKSLGAQELHMVDLDGAKTGERRNRGLILKTATASGLRIELGGGIRDMESIADYLENGITRVILGSAALQNAALVREAVRNYGGRIAVGIDAKDGLVATHGWMKTSAVSYLEFAKAIEQIGVKYIIFTDINSDGTLEGPNFEQLEQLKNTVDCRIIASGGIRDLEHIRKLRELGMYGAICGKSIYSGTLRLEEAISAGGEDYAG